MDALRKRADFERRERWLIQRNEELDRQLAEINEKIIANDKLLGERDKQIARLQAENAALKSKKG